MTRRMVVYFAGACWDGVPGTDRQLVWRLADKMPVLWVDPPLSALALLRKRRRGEVPHVGLSEVADGIHRLRSVAPPGVSRPFVRTLASAAQHLDVRAAVRRLHADVQATVLANPEGHFPALSGLRVYYLTDDWIAGAPLMGLQRKRVSRRMGINASQADLICAVSQDLLDLVVPAPASGRSRLLLPNGCAVEPHVDAPRPRDVPDEPFALLVGQLNERLDIAALREIVIEGTPLVLVGPRTERSAETRRAFDTLFEHPRACWLGPRRYEDLAGYLGAAAVGVTPYLNTAFNRSSFPLKTLEYLAAGLPAVSTDIPAVHWLRTDLVSVARNGSEFARMTRAWAGLGRDPLLASRRIAFAAQHSWEARAAVLYQGLVDAT
jgi:teichuronic acid biosynthesis glycosyltransferase TuaH